MNARVRVITINNKKEAKEHIQSVGSDLRGIKLMAPKGVLRALKLYEISVPAATRNVGCRRGCRFEQGCN